MNNLLKKIFFIYFFSTFTFFVLANESIVLNHSQSKVYVNKGDLLKMDDISLLSIKNGKKYDISKITKSEYKLISIWASWCEGCIKELYDLIDLQNKYDKSKLSVFAISEDIGDIETIKNFIEKNKLNSLEIYWDKDNILFKKFNFGAIPSIFLFNKENKLILKMTGWNKKALEFLETEINN